MKAVRNFKRLLARRPDFAGDYLTRSPTSLSVEDDPKGASPSAYPFLDTSRFDKDSLRAYKNSMIQAISSTAKDPDQDLKSLVKTLPHDLRDIFHHMNFHHAASSVAKDEETGQTAVHPDRESALNASLPRNDTRTGHARPPTEEDPIMLNIGSGDRALGISDEPRKSISAPPQGIEEDIFQAAYNAEVFRIRQEKGEEAKIFKTVRVVGGEDGLESDATTHFKDLPQQVLEKSKQDQEVDAAAAVPKNVSASGEGESTGSKTANLMQRMLLAAKDKTVAGDTASNSEGQDEGRTSLDNTKRAKLQGKLKGAIDGLWKKKPAQD